MKVFPLLLFGASSALANLSQGPVVTNAHGTGVTYTGLYANEIEGFIGIRFGQDTGGQNRFRPPVPYIPAAGSIIDATDKGPACPQRVDHGGKATPYNAYSYVTDISEDCLRLNVWRPNTTSAGDKLPVLVYIYGGGFNTGNKDAVLSQPGGMQLEAVKMGYPVMNVEMNYRLGIFGFAQTDALHKEGSENAGVRDQRLAIEWVYNNIEAFGGDPERITIHGQSSGGLGVGIQMLAYGNSRPYPFQQVIGQSQILEPDIAGNVSRHAMARVWKKTNCTIYSFDSAANAECLRSLPMEDLLKPQLETHSASPKQDQGDSWLPVVDGDFLPAAPSELLSSGRFANVTAIIGWADDDANLFTPEDTKTANQTYEFLRLYLPAMTEAHLQHLLSLYPVSDFHNTYFADGKIKLHAEFYRLGRIYRDILFTCQPILVGQALHKMGQTVYYYDQNQTMLTPDFRKSGIYGLGVVHTSELIYVFGNLTKYDLPGWPYHPRPSDYRLRVQQSRSWSLFAALGDPSGHEGLNTLHGWKPADFEDQNYGTMVIGGPTAGYSGPGGSPEAIEVMAAEKLTERCGFLNSPEIVKEIQY